MGAPEITARTSSLPSPDKQARDLISTNQFQECVSTRVDDVACAQNTDGEAVGTTIGAMAYRDPAQARQVFDKVMERTVDADERREVARGIAECLPPDLLRRVASTPDGRALLERARSELTRNLGQEDNELAATKLGRAVSAAELEKSAQFKALDPATQQTLLARIESVTASRATVANLIALAESPAFQAASPATRRELLNALAQHPKDTIFREGLERLANDPTFKGRTPAQQASAISAFTTAARSEQYQGKEGCWLFNVGEKAVSDADKRQILENAQRLITSTGYQNVGPDAQKAMMKALDSRPSDTSFAQRLLDLVQDRGFIALRDAGKQTRLLSAYGKDVPFARGIDTLRGDARFTALSSVDRAKVLTDMAKLHGTESYQDANANARKHMIEIVGHSAAQSAAQPNNAILRNTLDKVVDGRIKLNLFGEEPVARPDPRLGYAQSGEIHLNSHKATRAMDARYNYNLYGDALAHEVNHVVNGETKAGTADRFLDEYRAALAGSEAAVGRKLTPVEQSWELDKLVAGKHSGYEELAELYNNDARFKAVVDGMRSDLLGNPPIAVGAADARQRLLNAGFSSDYLKKAGNLDNH